MIEFWGLGDIWVLGYRDVDSEEHVRVCGRPSALGFRSQPHAPPRFETVGKIGAKIDCKVFGLEGLCMSRLCFRFVHVSSRLVR